ncbi:MAG: zf-HC2 domain-containing protein [Leptothrix sp. (in: b-proteobacteria)]
MRLNRLNRTCKEVTHLVLEQQERRLSRLDRVAIRIHLLICAACPVFARQVKLMQEATRSWRAYRDQGLGD